MELLAHEKVEIGGEPTHAVIWLHGLGASGHDFVPVVPELQLPSNIGVRFLFPHAPERPVTVNGGYIMPSWYDIFSMELEREIDEEQIKVSAASVHAFIDHQIAAGINSRNILIFGFSQGGAVAYQAALTYPQPLGGLVAMSTYFATPHLCQLAPQNAELPILVQHGVMDSVVPESLGRQAVERLLEAGWQSQYKTYLMDHELCRSQIDDLSAWIQQRFS